MPTTRYKGAYSFAPAIGLRSEVPKSQYSDYNLKRPWTPEVSEVEDPIAYGEEVFFHKSLPDGTSLSTEELRYIAAIVVNEYKSLSSTV